MRYSCTMLEQQNFKHGELIFREGEESDFAYLVVSGNVEIFKRTEKGTVLLSNLGTGELFGEMGLINDSPRSASAAADGPLTVKQISRAAMQELFSQSPPEINQMLRALMERLQESNQKISRLINKQSQFQLSSMEPPAVKRLSLIPLSAELKQQLGKGMVIQLPYRVGAQNSGVSDGDSLNMNNLEIYPFDDSVLSRNHFCIQKTAEGLQVVDRGSRSGTIVNNVHIGTMCNKDSALLTPGDNTISIGNSHSPYRFCLHWEIE